MAMMGGVLLVAGVITSVISKLLADELNAWIPWIARYITSFSARRLPKKLRERFGEEWASHLNEVPGSLGKILTAISFLVAVPRMGLAIKREEFVASLECYLANIDHLLQSAKDGLLIVEGDPRLTSIDSVSTPLQRLRHSVTTMEEERRKMANALDAASKLRNNFLLVSIYYLLRKTLNTRIQQLSSSNETADDAIRRIRHVIDKLPQGQALKRD